MIVLTDKELKRFWAKVDKNGPVVDSKLGQCWTWTASKNEKGYGQVGFRKKVVKAHRLSYLISFGQLDEELVLDHLCVNRSCVNPDHLEQTTQKVNIERGARAKKTLCLRGHSLEEFNLVKSALKDQRRDCLACSRAKAYLKNHDGDLQIVSNWYYEELLMKKN